MLSRAAPRGAVVLALCLAAACAAPSRPDVTVRDDGPPGESGPGLDVDADDTPSRLVDASPPSDRTVPPDVSLTDASAFDAAWSRDWTTSPAIVQLPRPATTFAVSDVHGGYARLVTLLVANSLLAASPATPGDARWTAGDAVLVVVGDLIDKGPEALEVIDLLRALQRDAAGAGGHVVVTLGNHEGEFLVDPSNAKATAADGIDPEITAMGLDPHAVASAMDDRGRWLRSLPFATRVGGWFFAHAGDTRGRDIATLEAVLRDAVDLRDYNDPEVIGTASILESRDWYLADPMTPSRYAATLGVAHIVMGHDPHALGADGVIAFTPDGALFRIDCGMSPDVDYSQGRLLRITRTGTSDAVDALSYRGNVTSLWTGPAAM